MRILASLGEREMAKRKPGRNDVVVGIAASGRTPFTVAALGYARSKGAKTIAVTCNRNTPLQKAAHLAIVAEVGPEVISGSTRMKAGTAQKMILNMLSTGAMTRLGYVYGNLMVNVPPKNSKLAARGVSILQRAASVDRRTAAAGAEGCTKQRPRRPGHAGSGSGPPEARAGPEISPRTCPPGHRGARKM